MTRITLHRRAPLLAALAATWTLASVAQARDITIVNRCSEQICPGLYGQVSHTDHTPWIPEGGGFCLAAGASRTISVIDTWGSARIWGRRGCDTGTGRCVTGDCGSRIACNGATGVPPTSLAEFTLRGDQGLDFYDISLVDGYDLPIAIQQTHAPSSSNKYYCGNPACVADLNATCAPELQVRDAAGRVVACMSACARFNTDQYCCRGAYNTAPTCPPFSYSLAVKAACPDAYSYAYDDDTSTYTCKDPSPNYTVTFCPNGSAPGGLSTTAWYQVVNANSGKCVDASWAGTSNGTAVLQYQCGSTQNQHWQLVPAGGGYYNLVPRYASWLTWDVNGGPSATGDSIPVQLWGFAVGASGTNQQWMPVSLGNGQWKVVARHSGKCLDVPGASRNDNVQLQQYTCNGTGAQAFRFVQVP